MADVVPVTVAQGRKEDDALVRTKEDLELAGQLLVHSQGLRDSSGRGQEARREELLSHDILPTFEPGSASWTAANADGGAEASRVTPPPEASQNGSYGPPAVMPADSVPSGQLCRYGFLDWIRSSGRVKSADV